MFAPRTRRASLQIPVAPSSDRQPGQTRPPQRHRRASATLDTYWPRLPDGEYHGIARRWEQGPAPWPARKLRAGETERRHDWHVYFAVEILAGLTPKTRAAIEEHRRRYDKRNPLVFYSCRFEVGEKSGTPFRPKSSTSKLARLLRIVSGTITATEVPYSMVIGWRFRLRLRTSKSDWQGDLKPSQEWYSVIDKILTAYPPGWQLHPEVESVSATMPASRRRAQAGSQPTGPAQGGDGLPSAGSDAEPAALRRHAGGLVELDP